MPVKASILAAALLLPKQQVVPAATAQGQVRRYCCRCKAAARLLAVAAVAALLLDWATPVLPLKDVRVVYPWWDDFLGVLQGSVLSNSSAMDALQQQDPLALRKELSALLEKMTPFVGASVDTPIHKTARPYPLPAINCSGSKYAGMFSGERHAAPVKVVLAAPLSQELFLLRMRLMMYDDVVDYHVVMESTVSHHSLITKPLYYERYKAAFANYSHKIVHAVVDQTLHREFVQAQTRPLSREDHWGGYDTERKHHHAIVSQLSFVDDDDIVVYGDLDEFPDEDFLNHLKHCKLPADARIPFISNAPFFVQDWRFAWRTWRSAYDIGGAPSHKWQFSLVYPTIWNMRTYRKIDPRRVRKPGRVHAPFVRLLFPNEPGGFHLTFTFWPAQFILKLLHMPEAGPFHQLLSANMTQLYLQAAAGDHIYPEWKPNIYHPSCLRRLGYSERATSVPWLVAQNPDAFPWLFLGERPYNADNPCRPQPAPAG